MKLQYLGTAAAEGVPGPFCDCEVCRRSRAAGGRNIRSRSQAVVDGTLLIDFPCDTFYHATLAGLNFLTIRNCLVTHVHGDHLYPNEIANLRPGFSHPPENTPPFTFWGSEDTAKSLEGEIARTDGRVVMNRLAPFTETPIAGYAVTALKAAHGTPHPYIYLIRRGGRTLLYAHDSDDFPEETWSYLKFRHPRLSFVSMDCTEGARNKMPYQGAHMCLGTNKKLREKLIKAGLATEGTPMCLNHFSHNGLNAMYDDFLPLAEAEGFLVSYDGMTVTF